MYETLIGLDDNGRFQDESAWSNVKSAMKLFADASFDGVVSLKSSRRRGERLSNNTRITSEDVVLKVAKPQTFWVCPSPRVDAEHKNVLKPATRKKYVLHFYQRPGSNNLTAGKSFDFFLFFFNKTSYRSWTLVASE